MANGYAIVALLLLALLLPTGLAALQPAPPEPPHYLTYRVQVGEVESVVSALGKLEAPQVYNLTLASTKPVQALNIQVGERVQAGQVLLEVDSTAAQLAYEQAVLGLEQAQVYYQEVLNLPTPEELTSAQANLSAAQGIYAEIAEGASAEAITVQQLRADQAQQRVTGLQQARTTMPGNLPAEAYRSIEAQIGVAWVEGQIANLRLADLQRGNPSALAEAGANVVLAEAQLARTQAGATPTQLNEAQIGIARAQARLLNAQAAIETSRLKSPVAGTVIQINTQVGLLLPSDSPAIVIMPDLPLRLMATIDENDVDQLLLGAPANVRVDALSNETFLGIVGQPAWMPTSNNGVITYRTPILIPQADERLKVGMSAEVRIRTDYRQAVLTVPNSFIRFEGAQAWVTLLRDDQTVEEVPIVVGIQGREFSEVISGVTAGMLLLQELPSFESGG